MKKQFTFLFTAITLTACSTGSILDGLPNRAPDYRQSTVSRKIEVPPDLSNHSLNDQLTVSDFTPAGTATYNSYHDERVQRDSRGYIQVLPQLYGVQVIENAGQLPYIKTAADTDTAWKLVKRYWLNNGVRLAADNPSIGIMETDWLDNKSNSPSTGISGFLNSVLGFLSDSGQRDRYRIRFSRDTQGGTDITLIYSKSEEVAQHDFQSGKNPAGYKWELSDNKNPELQLEMTRRIALFISSELKKNTPEAAVNTDTAIHFTRLNNQELALVFNAPYKSIWSNIGPRLTAAGYKISKSDYQTGTYAIEKDAAQYLLRVGANGQNQTVATVQTADGKPAPDAPSSYILQTIMH